jgi:hypothetical protein
METPTISMVRGPSVPSRFSDVIHSLFVVLVASLLCLPCLVRGVPQVGDSWNHTVYQHHFSEQFWSGDYYPRWLTKANKGYGSPIFLIQYPLPYWVTALLRPILRFSPDPHREAHELGVFCFLAIAGAGLAARRWLRFRFTPLGSTYAALVYICLPCVLGADLYGGVEIGQLSTFVWMPLALAVCDSSELTLMRLSVLGFIFALLIMSNVITTFLFVPVILAYSVVCGRVAGASIVRRSSSTLIALTLGCGIAGLYVLPLLAYRRLFDISAMPRMLQGFTVSSNLLFVAPKNLPRGVLVALICALVIAVLAVWSVSRAPLGPFVRVGCLVTLGLGATSMAPGFGEKLIDLNGMSLPLLEQGHFPAKMLATSVSTLVLAVFAYVQVAGCVSRVERRLTFLLTIACGTFVLTLPWCAFIWNAFPALSTSIQFPHRLSSILTVASVGLLGAAIDGLIGAYEAGRQRRYSLGLLTAVTLVVVGTGVLAWRSDWGWRNGFRIQSTYGIDTTREVDIMYRTYVSGYALESFAALTGTQLSSYGVARTPLSDSGAELVQGHGSINTRWKSPRIFILDCDVPGGGVARINQLYSPLWRTVSAGGSNPVNSANGLMEIPLATGHHELEVQFQGGWPESYGMVVTLASILISLGMVVVELHRRSISRGLLADTHRARY